MISSATTREVVLLCLLCGLRQREADTLLWDHVDTERGIISIKATKWYALKSETSRRRIGIPPKVWPLFAEWKALATGEFVIPSDRDAKVQTTYPRDRCKAHFDVVKAWLKAKGTRRKSPSTS